MHSLKTFGKIMLVAAAVVMMTMPAMAGNGKESQGSNSRGTGDRDRLKDGSCQDAIEHSTDLQVVARQSKSGDRVGTPKRDRLKDGSCMDAVENNSDIQLIVGDKIKLQDWIKQMLQDESCLEG